MYIMKNKKKPNFVSAPSSTASLLPFQNMMGKEEEDSDLLIKDDCELNESEVPVAVSEKKGKAVLRKKVKYQLVDYNSLPNYLKDNEYILRYYRCEWPLKQVLFSIFTIHNETLNVWTHLIGFFLFLSLTVYTVMKIPEVTDRSALQHLQEMFQKAANIIAPQLTMGPITRWPFFVFLSGAMFCLLASSACHLLSCHSERVSYIMLRLDYAGIAALISTSFYPPVYYSFMCFPVYCYIYMGVITILGLGSILVSLLPVFQSPEYRTLRASLFFGMGVSGAIPIFHKLILYWPQPEAIYTTGYELLMGALYGIGALIYAMRYPERWKPGKFDIAGSSHQIFHVLVVAGAYTHYQAGLIYLRWRDTYGC